MATDLDKLQGVWTVASLEVDGERMPADSLGNAQVVIERDRFKSVGMGATYEGRVEIDDTKKPKTFDLVFTSGPENGNRNPGIYKLDGDAWTLCLAMRGDKRPRKFVSEPDTGIALETLERGKRPASKSKPAGAVAPAGSGAPTELEGEWAMVSAVFNGAPMDQNMVKWCKRVTNGNVTTVLAGPQVMLKAAFTLGHSTKPATIDYVNLAGAAKGKPQSGIYELSGDTLRVCMSAPGGPRPSDFSSKPGDGRSYTVWQRM